MSGAPPDRIMFYKPVLPHNAAVLLAIASFFPGHSQEAEPELSAISEINQLEETKPQDPRAALGSITESIALVEKEVQETRKRLEGATETEQASIEAKLLSLSEKKEALQADFESIATGIDPTEYEGELVEEFVLSNEVDALLEPIIGELKELTEKPREIEQLRTELSRWQQRLITTEAALENLQSISRDEIPQSLTESLGKTLNTWKERKKQAENRIQALTYQLEQAEKSKPSFIQTAKEGLRSFYKSRGRNFLLCIIAFFATFFFFRYLHQQVDRYVPWKRKEKRPFYLRLIDVGLNILALVGAIIASLLTLYATGDWVLMGLAIILLIGAAIAAKNALPKFYDQARLLLNLGEIREGERVTYNGIPWKVERLSFYTILQNEAIRGGMVRLPVGQLSGMISRPLSEDGEIWFPCQEGDWVELADEGRGRVISQSPDFVQLVKLGGAKVVMPTVDFLGKSPKNLSGGFRISTTFGIDYKHQAECTGRIPEIMWAHITRELVPLVEDRELLLSLKVEFASAGASSLDYEIIADFDGALAPKIQVLERALQRFAVDCCNANGWEIPFTQITLHNAFPVENNEPENPEPAPSKLP